ncbi:MAG TPA: radical SAM protein [Deferrisomatales bacterium]|nr:radical SAM protein [Deferrisomatales bacterium]
MADALLLQLPAPDLRWPRLDANLPLAAGYLAAWARRRVPNHTVELLPRSEADLLGDEALLAAMLAHRPRLVGFSVYLWNAERTLHLARRLHAAGVPVVLGGPEVTPDNPWLWRASEFAHRVRGEGERAFAALLAGEPLSGTAPALDPAEMPSPYLDGVLAPHPDGSLWLETVRGCPFRCSYCNYGHRSGPPRRFPEHWLPGHLAWAAAHGGSELYLMDPSFNVRPDWERVLGQLEQGNRGGALRLHTELVADNLRPGDARRLAAAGLASCELGLQSTHPEVLAAAHRPWRRQAWLRGARELVDAGVETVVGLILGLPGDTPGRFRDSVEFVLERLPEAEIQVFPLALLPDTELRTRAAELALAYQPRPPYTVTRTPGFDPEELTEALHGFERRTGLELDPVPPPELGGRWRGGEDAPYWSGVRLEAGQRPPPPDWPERVAARAARHLTLWLRGWDGAFPGQVARLTALLRHGVLTVVLDDGAGWPPGRLGELLAAGSGDHFLDRGAVHLYGPGARLVPRLVALVDAGHPGANGPWQAAVRSRADWLWRLPVGAGWAGRSVELLGEGENLLVTGNPDPAELLPLAETLGHDAAGLQFADPATQARWLEHTGDDGFRAAEHRVELP